MESPEVLKTFSKVSFDTTVVGADPNFSNPDPNFFRHFQSNYMFFKGVTKMSSENFLDIV